MTKSLDQISKALNVKSGRGCFPAAADPFKETRAVFDDNQIGAKVSMIDSPKPRDHRDTHIVLLSVTETGHLLRTEFTRNEAITFARHVLDGDF